MWRDMKPKSWTAWLMPLLVFGTGAAMAGGGPLGIDHRLAYDNSGIWKRDYQQALEELLIAGELGGALWEGGETRLGRTFWQGIDSSLITAVATEGMKRIFRRERPATTSDPNQWFKGGSNSGFPSGEVGAVSAVVTPFVLEYGSEHPVVYALEVLPLYDAIARMKVRGHWQTDVLAGFAVGSAAGWYAHSRDQPLVLSVMPHGVVVGLRRQW
jgi:undecaprenyl-diphosphatase